MNSDRFKRDLALIDGVWTPSDGGTAFPVTDPSTGEVVGCVPNMGAAETRRAIDAAQAAGPGWRALTAGARAKILRRWFDLILLNVDDLAELLSREQGKALTEAKGEIAYAASFIEWFAEEGKRIYGETIPAHTVDRRIVCLKQAIGVVGAITPWNFPAAMITRKVGPALAAGCTVVLKPAEQTPLSALALAVLAEEAGVPAGVFNVVTGDARAIGAELTSNEKVRKLSFTGYTEVGRELMRQSAGTIKKLSLELGGNAPFVVFDDADVDAAVNGAIASKFRNSGQTCVCTNRFYVQDGVYEAFLGKLVARASTLRLGNGLVPETELGPLIDDAAVRKVELHVADAVAKGARVAIGGKRSVLGGTFFEPTVIANVASDMLIANEETFGPIAGIIRFTDEAEAVRLANRSEFGLASYFYARDLSRVWRVAEALEAGMVGINTGLISTEVAPFGGTKQSGLGREGSHHGIEDYLEIKYLCIAI